MLVVVLDLLGFCVETRPEYSRTVSYPQIDREITGILEHEDEQEHDPLNLTLSVDHPQLDK